MSELQVKTMAEFMAEGKSADILFWVGSAGSFDDRAKKITRAFVQILNKAGVNFGVLGSEESSSGDAAKRAGNEFLFQMQAMMNIEVMNGYGVKPSFLQYP
jgi:heterodisulfide reductase subunit D